MSLVVNGETVDDSVIQWETDSLRSRFLQMDPEQRAKYGLDAAAIEQRSRDWARENVIERVLLRQEAFKDAEPIAEEIFVQAIEELKKRQGGADQFSHTHPDEQEVRRQIEERVRVEKLLAKIVAKVSAPKLSEVAEFYRKHREQLRTQEAVHAAHIVKHVNEQRDEKTAEAEIRVAEEELKAGANFAEVADKHSDCPGNGGDLGPFARGVMVDEFDEVVFALEPGAISPVFRTPLGFHIARLIERIEPHLQTLPEVEAAIRAQLKQQKDTRAVENFVDRLKAKSDIREVPAETPLAAQL